MIAILLSFAVTASVSLLLTPLVRDLALRWNLLDRADNVRKLHQGSVPRLGGVAILLSYAWTLGLFKFIGFGGDIPGITDLKSWWLGLIAVGLVFTIGLWDDVKGLNAAQKVLGQTLAAVVAWFAGVQIEAILGHPLPVWSSLLLTVFWLVACSNAFNLIDGMDGLAGGVGFLAAATMFIAALVHRNLALMAVTLPLCGALLGFLRFNFNPASIFMGDSGSLTIGFLLGCFGVLWSDKSATLLGMAAPVMALAIPLLDASLAILRRMLRNQPLFDGDRRHVHHRLLDLGLTPRRAALLIYAVSIAGATAALVANSMNDQFAGAVVLVFCGLMFVGIQYLGYIEFGTATRMLTGGWFQKSLNAQVQLQLIEEQLKQAETVEQCWNAIRTAYPEFGFYGVRMKVDGDLFEQIPNAEERYWQVRIPLEGQQYVNFYSPYQRDQGLRMATSFITVVEAALRAKLSPNASQAIEIPKKGPQRVSQDDRSASAQA